MKRIIALILIISSLLSFCAFAEGGVAWPEVKPFPVPLRRMPDNNWYSNQNPPSFLWNFVEDAALYEIVVCEDEKMEKVVYKGETDKNMYNFSTTFETEKEYFWSVRFKTKDGAYSVWAEPFRFMIDADATEFTVTPVENIAAALKKEHPRMFFTPESLEHTRKYLDRNNASFKSFEKEVERFMSYELPKKPEFHGADKIKGTNNTNFWYQPTRDMGNVALMYMLTGEKRYLDRTVAMLENLFEWNPEEAYDWSQYADTAEGLFSINYATVYDWLYNELTPEQREKCVRVIERNIKRPFEHFGKNGELKESLYHEPYNSHGWSLSNCAIAALAIYEESELARRLADFHVPILFSLWEPYRYQSGASSQGPFYGNAYDEVTKMMMFSTLGIGDMREASLFKNMTDWYLYLWPTNWLNNVGDAYNSKPAGQYQHIISDSAFSYVYQGNEIGETAKWMLKRANAGRGDAYVSKEFLTTAFNLNGAEAKLPVKKANDRLFADVGWAALHSDISDDYRIGMTFKSSFYGSYNHSHPDQNSFVIQGYGEPLAIDSGYYDYYKSSFDLEYDRKTYAHNAITYDEGMGQTPFSDVSKGMVTGFVGSDAFAYVSGDAKKAYAGKLNRSEREIIYIKPDVFIVIDDLEAKGKSATFEYWLNALGDIAVYEDKNGATVTKGAAALDVTMHYPENVKTEYINVFAGPDLAEVPPPSSVSGATDKRIYFATPPVKNTKMVSTLSVRRGSEEPQFIEYKNYGSYIKLSLDGVNAYINLTDEEVKTKDGFTFSGSAFVYDKNGYILTCGRKAVADGRTLISSDVPVTATVTGESISISSLYEDANVSIFHKGIKGLNQHYSDMRRPIPEKIKTHGIYWEKTEEGIKLSVYPGTYLLYEESAYEPGGEDEGVLTLEIGDKIRKIPFKGVYNVKGQLLYDYYPEETGVYKLLKAENVSISNTDKDSLFLLSPAVCIMTTGKEAYLKLEPLGSENITPEITENPDELKKKAVVLKYADEYARVEGKGNLKYWSSIGRNTLQGINDAMASVTYSLNVPESGYYDVVMSVSTVSGASPTRMYSIGGKQGLFVLPPTEVYSDLKGTRLKLNAYLEKGENKLTFYAIENGEWIIDWVGIARSEVQK